MANALYTAYKNQILGSGSLSLADWDTDTIKVVLCSAGYTASINTDSVLSDIPGGARIATATIAGIAITAGAATVSRVITFPAVSGSACTQLVLYKDTGSAATSPLLVLFDTFDAGMPVTPTGTDITLGFNVAGILQL